jgi:hypothetical protein
MPRVYLPGFSSPETNFCSGLMPSCYEPSRLTQDPRWRVDVSTGSHGHAAGRQRAAVVRGAQVPPLRTYAGS